MTSSRRSHARSLVTLAGLGLSLVACVPAPANTSDSNDSAGSPATCEPFPPYFLDVQAEPNGLAYRADRGQLYIADDDNNRILIRDDDDATQIFAEIPNDSNDPGANGLGGLTFTADGELFVPRFGFGKPGLGAIFQITEEGVVTAIDGLNDEWRRLGLDYDDIRGRLYVATYSRDADDVYTGWVTEVDPVAGGERTVIDGLRKPVGIAVIDDTLFVADQDDHSLYRVDLNAASPLLELVSDEFEALDHIHATPDGDLLVPTFDIANGVGRLYRVTPSGDLSTLAEGTWEPRGLAFDGISRVFISARRTQTIVVVPAC